MANIGQGPARNLNMKISADEDDLKRHDVHLFKVWGKKTIRILPQGEKIVALLGGLELFKEPAIQPFKVDVSYEDISGARYASENTLDANEFLGLSRVESSQAKATEALKKMASAVTAGRLQVQIKE